MINSKGETIYTNAELAYEVGISPATIAAIGQRIFGGGHIQHWTLNDARLIFECIKQMSAEEEAKRLSRLHQIAEEIFDGEKK